MLEIRMGDLGKHELMTEDFNEWRNIGELCLKFMIAPKVKKFCMVGNGERGEMAMIYSSRLFT